MTTSGSGTKGATRVAFWRATSVWARMRPYMEASVWRVTPVAARMMPSKWDPAPKVMASATAQTMLVALAPLQTRD